MSRKIKNTCEYRDDYRETKKQMKKYIYRVSYTDREHLKKKDRLNKRKCADELYQ